MKERNLAIVRTHSRDEVILEIRKAQETIMALSKQQEAVARRMNSLVCSLQPDIVSTPRRLLTGDLVLVKSGHSGHLDSVEEQGQDQPRLQPCDCSGEVPVDLITVLVRGFMFVIFLLVLNAVIMGAVLNDQVKARSKRPAPETTNSTKAIESLLDFPEQKKSLKSQIARKDRL